MACINIKHPEYINLVNRLSEFGITNPVDIQGKIHEYQEETNTDLFPGLDYFNIEDEVVNDVLEKRQNKVQANQQQLSVVQPSNIVKEGVEFVFEQNPELANIGSQEQYSQYLDTIFPDSKVKDIVYRGGGNVITKAVDSTFGTGYYFTPDKDYAKNFAEIAAARDKGYNLLTAVLNLNNPLIYVETKKQYKTEISEIGRYKQTLKSRVEDAIRNKKDIPTLQGDDSFYIYKEGKYYNQRGQEKSLQDIEEYVKLSTLKSSEDTVTTLLSKSDLENIKTELNSANDGVVVNITEKYEDINKEYIVFAPNQIHILGSKQDIEGFKKFVNNTNTLQNFEQYFPDYSYLNEEERIVFIKGIESGDLTITCTR